MKKRILQLMAVIVVINFLPSTTTPQENSAWLRNLSEGMGAPVNRYEDFATEVECSGNMVHTLWLTWKGEIKELNYRRSTDNGISWDSKVTLFEDNLDYDRRYRRMSVSGNYVHIVVNENIGTERQLLYFRSADGGSTFEPPKVLYTTQFWIYQVNIDSEGSMVRISMAEDCHFCATKKWIYLIKSDDNGVNFENKLIAEDVSGSYTDFTSLTVEGQNVYLLYRKGIGYWANYDFELHMLSSNDGGNNFTDQVLSQPAMSGEHHVFPLLDYNNVYNKKIAVDGSKIWVVWSGWDETNTPTIFVKHSANAGATFGAIKKISGSLTNIHAGMETIAAIGNNVYVALSTTNALIYKNQSSDGGDTFTGFTEFTRPNSNYLRNAIEPQLYIDPKDGGAYLLASGAIMGKILPDGSEQRPGYYGYFGFNTNRRPKLAVSSNGFLHLIMEGGGEWTQTGGFTDLNLWYRRINPNLTDLGEGNHALQMDIFVNAGDGSGIARYDNMIIGPELGKQFSNAMTIEFWVKPDAVNDIKKILTQNRLGTWNLYDPVAFQLWATTTNEPVAGLVTGTGAYVLPGVKKMVTGFWNHIAVTFQNDGSAGNFKLLLNGQVANQITVTGTISDSDALWILGSIQNLYTSDGFKGSIDELRFWNIARTEEQIRSNLFVQLQGNEQGLVAYYRFDAVSPFGEITDLTGKGHTGNLMYKEELVSSGIKDPKVSYTYVQSVTEFYFTGISDVKGDYKWDFGDNTSSNQLNPYHKYSTPGVYDVCFSVQGNEMTGNYCEKVEVFGIDKVLPAKGGNTGYVTAYIYGGGLGSDFTVLLSKSGSPEIVAETTYFENSQPSLIRAVFNLNGKPVGLYDVIIKKGNKEDRLEKAFTIEKGVIADPFVSITGPHNILINRWSTYSVTVGNHANIDAHGVPVWLAFTGDVEVSFVGLDINTPDEVFELGWENLIDSIHLINEFDTLFGQPMKGKLVSLYFPIIPAHFNKTFSVRIRSLSDKPNQIMVWNTPPLYASPLNSFAEQCMYEVLVYTVLKSGIEVFIPGSGCVFGGLELLLQFKDDVPPPPGGNTQSENFLMHLSTAAAECLTTWNPISGLLQGFIFTGSVSAEIAYSYNDCKHGFRPLNLFTFFYYVLYSFDPNEKSGLPGYGENNYVGALNSASYQINFENKATATAPAQEVIIVDTINSGSFDWRSFSFSSFSFGDSVFYPSTGVYEFGMDIDRRPYKDHIVRVTGIADTLNNIITWKFTTLDPQSFQLPEDALGGFLPPNVNSPEGEGFVSFVIGLKENKIHNQSFSNKAEIIFDSNPSIITNNYSNIFDLKAPESYLTGLEEIVYDTILRMNISGVDDGCGIREYEIFVSINDGPYQFAGTAFSSPFLYSASFGNNYKFYSIAIDSVGNREEVPSVPDVVVSVSSVDDSVLNLHKFKVYPQPAGDFLVTEFELTNPDIIALDLYDLTGKPIERLASLNLNAGRHRFNFPLKVESGFYILKAGNVSHSQSFKIVVMK